MTLFRPFRMRQARSRYKFPQGERAGRLTKTTMQRLSSRTSNAGGSFRDAGRGTPSPARLRKEAACLNTTAKGRPINGALEKKLKGKSSDAAVRHTSGRRLNRVGKHWLSKPAIIYRGEREICNPATVEGRAEYKYRTLLLWVRQDAWCCFREYDFCPGRMKLSEATFEHEGKRTKAQRDDRIAIFDKEGRFIRHLNGAAHLECNLIAGSRKLQIWHGNNVHFEKKRAA